MADSARVVMVKVSSSRLMVCTIEVFSSWLRILKGGDIFKILELSSLLPVGKSDQAGVAISRTHIIVEAFYFKCF